MAFTFSPLMPLRGERRAPTFDPRVPRTLATFLDDLDTLFTSANIISDEHKKVYAWRYASIDDSDLWQVIPEADASCSYREFVGALYRLYPGSESVGFTRRDLEELVTKKKAEFLKASPDRESLGEFYRSFISISFPLVKSSRLSIPEQSRRFGNVFPSSLYAAIDHRLQVRFPSHEPDDPWPLADLYEAALWSVGHVSASSPLSRTPSGTPSDASHNSSAFASALRSIQNAISSVMQKSGAPAVSPNPNPSATHSPSFNTSTQPSVISLSPPRSNPIPIPTISAASPQVSRSADDLRLAALESEVAMLRRRRSLPPMPMHLPEARDSGPTDTTRVPTPIVEVELPLSRKARWEKSQAEYPFLGQFAAILAKYDDEDGVSDGSATVPQPEAEFSRENPIFSPTPTISLLPAPLAPEARLQYSPGLKNLSTPSHSSSRANPTLPDPMQMQRNAPSAPTPIWQNRPSFDPDQVREVFSTTASDSEHAQELPKPDTARPEVPIAFPSEFVPPQAKTFELRGDQPRTSSGRIPNPNPSIPTASTTFVEDPKGSTEGLAQWRREVYSRSPAELQRATNACFAALAPVPSSRAIPDAIPESIMSPTTVPDSRHIDSSRATSGSATFIVIASPASPIIPTNSPLVSPSPSDFPNPLATRSTLTDSLEIKSDGYNPSSDSVSLISASIASFTSPATSLASYCEPAIPEPYSDLSDSLATSPTDTANPIATSTANPDFFPSDFEFFDSLLSEPFQSTSTFSSTKPDAFPPYSRPLRIVEPDRKSPTTGFSHKTSGSRWTPFPTFWPLFKLRTGLT